MKLGQDPDEITEARQLMRALGIPDPANVLYLALIRTAAVREAAVAELLGLSSAAAEQAVSYLKLFRLISQDVEHGDVVLFVSDPQNAWKAHDADFYWMRFLHVGDIEALPPLPSLADEERRRLYLRLEKVCGPIYDRNVKAHDPLRHQHRDIKTGELFASWLAATIGSAARTIVAVDMPPRLPDLAPIWVALTRRIRDGVTYTRIVTAEEIAEHGLDIVKRDMDEYGIDLRLGPPGFIKEAFYLVDRKRLLLKNVRGLTRQERGQHYGVYTSKHPIVRRYVDKFESYYLPGSRSAAPIVEELMARGEAAAGVLRGAGRGEDADVFDRVVRFGKFAQGLDAKRVERLISEGLVSRNAAGHIVATIVGEVTLEGG